MLRQAQQINRIIVHCSATPNGKPVSPATIDRWHERRNFMRGSQGQKLQQKSLPHIGYHYLIQAPFGGVVRARHWREVGAHCYGENNDSVAVCIIGTDAFSAEQWHDLRRTVQALKRKFKLKNSDVYGHRDFSNKICPGFDVGQWLARGMRPLAGHIL